MNTLATVGLHVQHSSQPAPRLIRAAQEFEGQMMKELLKPLNSADALTGADDGDDNASGALSDFASEALGQALSKRGGFGIADSIVRQLCQSGTKTESAKVTQQPHVDTQLRALR